MKIEAICSKCERVRPVGYGYFIASYRPGEIDMNGAVSVICPDCRSIPTVHVAGPMIDLIQKCARCDYILVDYTRTMALSGENVFGGWAEGIEVTVSGVNPIQSIRGAEPGAIRCDAKVN